ncbi:hypothetical protein Bbelb_287390 [Branchiostoma belcheri]|nr:hypothetical protein Bbelb_287390 [Branchiostoma belcheri]
MSAALSLVNQTAVSSALSLRRRERLGPPTRPRLPRFGGRGRFLRRRQQKTKRNTGSQRIQGNRLEKRRWSVRVSHHKSPANALGYTASAWTQPETKASECNAPPERRNV